MDVIFSLCSFPCNVTVESRGQRSPPALNGRHEMLERMSIERSVISGSFARLVVNRHRCQHKSRPKRDFLFCAFMSCRWPSASPSTRLAPEYSEQAEDPSPCVGRVRSKAPAHETRLSSLRRVIISVVALLLCAAMRVHMDRPAI
ncbi:hypothetical protein MPTK1_2g21370 [Marchantia polymorpha subsp. ruderalis]|uniref:Uncharacterized protein n=1 Tax=Marchantia polymorpha TaxID=3197 RepID=A0A2R6X2R9_MARPO|nr:hypothetical protein MARPO_0040s0077 [Marchantia polymorpha]BBN03173.1 hypothetical protein Mp_2g21370 [Marchantia polymorpha subsp. ruderalis]|eukprot:PTQ40404.1 hypothetical protein MARPO_0040s0077 [Marchantia polymorpha]